MKEDLSIVAGGRELPDALDRIRRYCGLPWSGGAPETWAWHFDDEVPTADDDDVIPTDVLCASSLHPGLSRADLAFGSRLTNCQRGRSRCLREFGSGRRRKQPSACIQLA